MATRRTLKVGDRITAKYREEAQYSRSYAGSWSAYPECWFEPGDVGVVMSVNCPVVRQTGKRTSFHSVEFTKPTPRPECSGAPGKPIDIWRVALSPDNVVFLDQESV